MRDADGREQPGVHAAGGQRGRGGVVETVGAVLVAVVGVAVTTYGAFVHAGALMAPGSALALGGGAWLGNALARRGVSLFPRPSADRRPAAAEKEKAG